ncbi:MAG: hypothetical protein K2Y37_03480 [Pirellulales bacterium]|nr:hypothetical protein [Pirellulales bacterium]
MQLFPFLAVLLCMMGALILLLVVIARHARAQAQAEGVLAPPAADSPARREELDWRRGQLVAQRDRTQSELGEKRLELGHYEEHARALRAELAELESAQAQLDQLASTDAEQKRELQDRVAALNQQLTETQAKLLAARQKLASQPSSFSIVPYLGPNGTNRPPLFIECRSDSIVLQPEGVVLQAEDFEGPLGPGNPLASALRAAREHLARYRRTNVGEMGEPYPLLLVRPDGIMAYWMARAALESWGGDFGYELIDADWNLDFRAPDAELARSEQTAVAEARVHQRELAAMMPRLQGHGTGRQYRASSSGGGIVADEELPDDDLPGHRTHGAKRNGRRGYFDPYPQSNPDGNVAATGGQSATPGEPGGNGLSFQGNGNGLGSGPSYPAATSSYGRPGGGASLLGGNDGGLYPGEAPLGPSSLGGPIRSGSPHAADSSASGGSLGGTGSNAGSFAGTGEAMAAASGAANDAGGSAHPGGSATPTHGSESMEASGSGAANTAARGSSTSGSGTGGAENQHADANSPGGANATNDGPALVASGGNAAASGGISSGGDPQGTQRTSAANSGTGGPTQGGQPATSSPSAAFTSPLDSFGTAAARSGAPPGSSVTSPSSSGSLGGGSGSGSPSPGTPSINHSAPPTGSMAEHRGKNWAVPDEVRRAAPVTRPVMIRCSQSSLVILDDDGSGRQVRAVPLAERTEDSVDDLLTGVWDHITSWGLAGHGMYWHPVLVLDTTADGAARAADLKRLLAGSGIEVRDKKVNPPVARTKKKRWWLW